VNTTPDAKIINALRQSRASAKAKALENPEMAGFAAGMAAAYSIALIMLETDGRDRCDECSHDLEDHDDGVCEMAMCMCGIDHEEEETIEWVSVKIQDSLAVKVADIIETIQEERIITETDVVLLSVMRNALRISMS